MAPRGRPRDTPEKRALRRLQREAHRQKLQQTAQHLRNVEALAKNELASDMGATRRSLRIVSKKWNKKEPGQYTFILFGEEGWDEKDEYDHQIWVNFYDAAPGRRLYWGVHFW
jgi:hypothetical protein